ncbi:hypothetical protein GCM10010112_07260 [Actinoplanes lobatus]|uniref:PPE family domain-containing protein n=1 Tax=Actinoplanes lobatus TaxID=113568 RepID=A0A7W7HAX4_9ACTN|nr:hypothetical protein [Actinoplanes lobatus]MBB4747146.1 hypothetical protein [Actinoplanes lobatus]GGN55934.1 hypothetical protein GCM10010112_07260 [Actinoplanes lobatus]GIE39286.1 hypothetical protein Alo02nite_21840 [Actinoplanes lobatus]
MGIETGGGISGTSWNGMSVDAMWELIHDHDSAPHQEMGDAWYKSAKLLENHVSQVRSYRDRLAEAWPPEKSRAAYAYIERLEQLIISLEETRLASNTNWRVLTTTIEAVEQAKEKVAGIQKEYAANREQLQKYEKAKNEVALATMDPIATTPPVPYSRQDDLTTQARVTMQSLSAELAAAQSNFIAPKPFDPKWIYGDNFDSLDSGGTGSVPASTVPPFNPRSITPTKTSKTTVPGSGIDKSTQNPGGTNDKPGTSKPAPDGPILGGTKTQPPPTTTLPTTSTTTTIPPNPNSPNPYTITPTIPSTTTTAPRTPVMNNPSVGTFPPAAGGRGTSVPHGGVIGGSPTGMLGGPPPGRGGQPGMSTRGTQRVNPIGGLIGQDGGTRASRRPSSRNNEEASSQRWDPDNPWETAEGIDPVLLPPTEHRIDPGPTIGGR